MGDVTWVNFETRIDDRIDSHAWVQRQHGSCHLAICLIRRRVKFKFRINRSIEGDSRVYFGKADIDALHFRDTGGTGVQKIMAHGTVKIIGFNSTAIRFPCYQDFVNHLVAR
jgi:hypothetical protein